MNLLRRESEALWPTRLTGTDSSHLRGSGGARGGFTLIEVLCAIVILGVALAGLTQGITLALRSSKDSELQTTAALFAAGRIETVRAEGYITDGTSEGDCGDELPLYRWSQTISSAGIDGLHNIEVTVSNARTGKAIYELQTQVFERPEESSLSKSERRGKKRGGTR
jgi:prepilin-type N-terminal cleavage/methylation domain-containing protein